MRAARMTGWREDAVLVAPALVLLALAFLLPLGQIVMVALQGPEGGVSLAAFVRFLGDAYYLPVALRTIRLSLIVTLLCAALGFPLAYLMARLGSRWRLRLVTLVILPLMTSVVVRTFGWMVVLGRGGLIPFLLWKLGLVGRNFTLMQTESAVVLGLAQVLLPFMTLSILGVVLRIDPRLEEAARTMGCGFGACLRHVVLPLAWPGVAAGSLLVFTLSASSFITPALLGGVRLPVMAASIYDSATKTLDWPFAAAQSIVLLAAILAILVPYARLSGRRRG